MPTTTTRTTKDGYWCSDLPHSADPRCLLDARAALALATLEARAIYRACLHREPTRDELLRVETLQLMIGDAVRTLRYGIPIPLGAWDRYPYTREDFLRALRAQYLA